MSRERGTHTRLREAVHVVDLLVILAVPVVLALVFALPTPTRESLTFSAGAPTAVSAYTAHFVHLDSGHLLGNLAVYGLTVPTAYLLATLGNCRRAFAIPFVAVLLSFPAILSALHLALETPGMVFGFSGLNMAFVGTLPLFVTVYLSRLEGSVRLDHAPVLFFSGTAVVAFRVVPPGPVGLAVVAGISLTALVFAVYAGRAVSRETITDLAGGSVEFDLVVGGVVVFFLAVALGFPEDPGRSNGVVGVYTHFLGYAVGFVSTYLVLRIDDPTRQVPSPPDERPE